MEFAAFIMTFRRPTHLASTIQKLREQSMPPEFILVIDNCPDRSAEDLADNLGCGYHNIGYNSGPAGAAYFGLKLLFEAGWEWVIWVDDDDPPVLPDQFASIFNILANAKEPGRIGVLGSVGSMFDFEKVEIKRIADDQLHGVLEVDMVAGNQFPLVNRRMYEAGILPNPDLFFGFEDLEYGLRIKKAGYSILVSGELMHGLRSNFKKLNFQKPLYKKRNKNVLWREYYSARSMTFLLKHVHHQYKGLANYRLKIFAKSAYGFRFGLSFGLHNMKMLLRGFQDGLKQKFGATVLPVSKKNIASISTKV